MSFESKRPVTVEDLLRLKRTERPPAEFWEQFDRELRAKQLAALVEKRPWWRSLPQWRPSWWRYHLPLGATAALALTFFVVRQGPALPPPAVENTAANPVAPAPAIVAVPANAAEVAPADATAVAPAPAQVGELVTQATAAAVEVPANFPSLAATTDFPAAKEVSPSARHIAANLRVAQMTEPGLTRGILSEPVADVTPAAMRSSVEPLSQIPSASGSRYARLRTAMATPILNTVVRAADRVTRDLSDERLSEDAIRRFAAKGDRVSVKF